jgi:hypothetical protein
VQWFAISAGDSFLLDVDPRNAEGAVEPGTLEARDAGGPDHALVVVDASDGSARACCSYARANITASSSVDGRCKPTSVDRGFVVAW